MPKLGGPLWQYIPPSQPATPASCASSVSQQLSALQDWLTDAAQQTLNGLVSSMPSAFSSTSACTQYAAGAADTYSALILTAQAKFDQLLLSPMTPEEAAAIAKQAQATIDALRKQRDAILATILKRC